MPARTGGDARGAGQFKPDPKNLDHLWAWVPY